MHQYPPYYYVGAGKGIVPYTPTEFTYYQPKILEHEETFESDYNFDLQKYCAETGKDLENSQFEIYEAFDDNQLGDGTDGTVGKNFMSPKLKRLSLSDATASSTSSLDNHSLQLV